MIVVVSLLTKEPEAEIVREFESISHKAESVKEF